MQSAEVAGSLNEDIGGKCVSLCVRERETERIPTTKSQLPELTSLRKSKAKT